MKKYFCYEMLRRQLEVGSWRSAAGGRQLEVGRWRSAAGGTWLPTTHRSDHL